MLHYLTLVPAQINNDRDWLYAVSTKNVCRLALDPLKFTCNFLHCNHQMQRDFLITLYIYSRRMEKITD